MSIAMEDWPRRHRITVDEYRRLAASGSFAPDARVELIEGEIIDMPPIGSPHAAMVTRLHRLLDRAIADRALLRCQLPIQLGQDSEPVPDLAVVHVRTDFYRAQHPTSTDTLLVIEISDTTLKEDLRRKMKLYARHGIVEYWVVDVANGRLHVFRRPHAESYEQSSSTSRPDRMDVAALPGCSVDLSALFPDS